MRWISYLLSPTSKTSKLACSTSSRRDMLQSLSTLLRKSNYTWTTTSNKWMMKISSSTPNTHSWTVHTLMRAERARKAKVFLLCLIVRILQMTLLPSRLGSNRSFGSTIRVFLEVVAMCRKIVRTWKAYSSSTACVSPPRKTCSTASMTRWCRAATASASFTFQSGPPVSATNSNTSSRWSYRTIEHLSYHRQRSSSSTRPKLPQPKSRWKKTKTIYSPSQSSRPNSLRTCRNM